MSKTIIVQNVLRHNVAHSNDFSTKLNLCGFKILCVSAPASSQTAIKL